MIAYPVYNVIHFIGIFLTLVAYGGLIVRAMLGSENRSIRKMGAITSGIGLFLILLGGFGMQARLGYAITEGWLLAKIVIWVIVGAMLAGINRMPKLAMVWWWGTIILASIASYLCTYKPF